MSLAQARQIILEMKNGTLIATGVVFTDSISGNVMNITATKEVILSAGVFQTPQLLMLSGIGPQQTLQQFGIPAYHTNENIGRHMQDHCYFSVIARVRKEVSASQLYNRIDLLQAAQKQYTENHTGPLTSPVGPTYGFQQIPATELRVLDTTGALENRTNQAHIEYLWENLYYPSEPSTLLSQYPPNLNESFMSVTAAVLAPVSRGNISFQSNTIGDAPVINVNYLESEVDQRIALYGFKNLRKILSQPELANFTIGPDSGEVVPGASITDDETLLTYIKSTLLPVWHASGTATMLPEADGGVVDDRLKVYGISGLRVVDASIIPVIPDQHIQGTVYMIAEKAADMIKEDYELV